MRGKGKIVKIFKFEDKEELMKFAKEAFFLETVLDRAFNMILEKSRENIEKRTTAWNMIVEEIKKEFPELDKEIHAMAYEHDVEAIVVREKF